MKKLIKALLFTLLVLQFNPCSTYSQDRNELEKQRMNLIKQIESTSQTLDKTKKNKTETIAQYNLLEQQIESRKDLIGNLNSSLEVVDIDLKQNEETIDSLTHRFQNLTANYKELLQIQLRKKIIEKPWMIILSSNSLSDALSKWRYFQQYQNYFKEKSAELMDYKTALEKYQLLLDKEKQNKTELLGIENEQASLLEEERKEKNSILKTLSQSELKLQASLKKQKNERESLNRAIEEIIKRKMLLVSIADDNVSGAFISLKGKLDWPIHGKIIKWFGKQNHPELKNIHIENNGIDILTENNFQVKNIYPGKVVTVSFIPGHQNMVMIQHGKYFSVYSKLAQVTVNPGDELTKGDIIGVLATNDKNKAELHFEIWNGKQKENPANWIKL